MRALALFNELDQSDVDWIFEKGVEQQVITNTIITHEGKDNDALYVVLEGLLAVHLEAFGDNRVNTLGPGEIVGEMQFLTGEPASATVSAAENTLMLVVYTKDIHNKIEEDARFASRLYRAFAKTVALRLQQSMGKLSQAANQRDAEESVAIDLWGNLEQRIAGFKVIIQKADKEAIENFGEISQETCDIIRNGFRQFSIFLNNSLGDKSGHSQRLKDELGAKVQQEMLPYMLLTEMGERIYAKPRGYAGDFYTIEIMYRNKPSGAGRLGPLLDECFYREPACIAVQNRRGLLAEEIFKVVEANGSETTNVISMASGPAAELFDVFEQIPDKSLLKANCIDIDLQALAFVGDKRDRLRLRRQMELHNGNLVYLATGRQKLDIPPQDLAYSIGLIDYFNDKFVIALLNYVYDILKPGGKVILGNFHPDNTTKALMDYVIDWKLIHRDEGDMHNLYKASKFGRGCSNIRYEEQNINLFAECIKE